MGDSANKGCQAPRLFGTSRQVSRASNRDPAMKTTPAATVPATTHPARPWPYFTTFPTKKGHSCKTGALPRRVRRR